MKEIKLFKLDKNGKLKNKYVLLRDISIMSCLPDHISSIPFYTASGKAKGQNDLSKINLNTLILSGQINLSDAKTVIYTMPMGFAVNDIINSGFKGQITNPLFTNKLNNLTGVEFQFNDFIDILSKNEYGDIKNMLNHSVSIHSIAILDKNQKILAYGVDMK